MEPPDPAETEAVLAAPVPDSAVPVTAVVTPAQDRVDSPGAGRAALRGSALRGGAYAGTVLLSLISAPLLIRHLGLVEFGRYTTVIALVTVVGGLTDAGMVTIAVREWSAREGRERADTMRALLGLRIELSMAAVAGGVAFALLAGYGRVLVLGTLLAGVGMMFQVCADLLTAPLQGELRFGWASVIDLSRQITLVLAIVLLVLAGASLAPFFAVTIPSSLVALALATSLAHKRMPLRPSLRGGHRWSLLRAVLPYSVVAAINTFYFRVTLLTMSLISSPLQTGYFATSFRVTEVLAAVPVLAIGAAFPILARSAGSDADRFDHATRRILELALIAGAALVLTVVLIAPFAINLLAGHAGRPAASVLQIQGLAMLATFVSVASSYALLALGRTRVMVMANVGALGLNIALTLVLAPLDGAHGAAIAAATAECCLGLGQMVMLMRTGRGRVSRRTVLAVAVAGGVGATPLLVPVDSLLRTIGGLIIFTVALALLGLLPPEVLHAIRPHRRSSR